MSVRIPPAERDELLAAHRQMRHAIRSRLADFRAVPLERRFYEVCFCLMTPQSSAVQCDAVARELERRGFRERPFDPAPLLRSFAGGYVRFHNTKARRLLRLREDFDDVQALLDSPLADKEARTLLAGRVDGFGMKEASHVLRNIGRTDVTIIDRHILRNLVRLGLLPDWPANITPRRYLEIEALFDAFAASLGVPADELDLLLWSRETGFVLR